MSNGSAVSHDSHSDTRGFSLFGQESVAGVVVWGLPSPEPAWLGRHMGSDLLLRSSCRNVMLALKRQKCH